MIRARPNPRRARMAAAALTAALAAWPAIGAPSQTNGAAMDFAPARCVRPSRPGGTGVDVKYELEWPVAAASTQALARVRTALWSALHSMDGEIPADQTAAAPDFDATRALEARANSLAREYAAFRRSFPDSAQEWYSHASSRVTFRHPAAVTVRLETDEYLGGAHPNAVAANLVFDPATGRRIGPWDVFLAAKSDALLAKIKAALRKVRGLPERASLESEGFWEKDIAPRNMAVDAKGAVFTYNTYDIAPYAMGATEVRLDWKDLKDLLDPEGPLGSFRKQEPSAP